MDQVNRSIATAALLLGCLLAWCPASAQQGRAGEARLKAYFEDAGFAFHGQMAGFRPTANPVRTEHGTVIAGIPYFDRMYPNRRGLVWHLESGGLDILTPPIEPGDKTRWGTFARTNARGQMAFSIKWLDDERGMRRSAYLVSEHDELFKIDHPEPKKVHPIAMNAEGQVVGVYHIGPSSRGYIWSVEAGFEHLPAPEKTSSAAYGINASGDVVGILSGSPRRGAVWQAPEEPGGPRKVIELLPPEGCESLRAHKINDRGQVIVDATRPRRGDKPGHINYLSESYLWTQEKGYTRLRCAGHDSDYPYAIDRDGNVLIQARVHPQADPSKPEYPYYLHRAGKAHPLPKYPGADRTDYYHMSDDGLVVGLARFFSTNKQKAERDRLVCFVLSWNGPEAKRE